MNLIQKIHALMVHPDVRIWHYHVSKEKPFEYSFAGETHRFDTMEQMVEAAYERIDPLRKALPQSIEEPAKQQSLEEYVKTLSPEQQASVAKRLWQLSK